MNIEQKEVKENKAEVGEQGAPVPTFAKKEASQVAAPVTEQFVVEEKLKETPPPAKPLVDDDAIRTALKEKEELEANKPKVNHRREVHIKPYAIGSDIGELLPGAKKTYIPYKDQAGHWVTGMTESELKSVKSLKLWDDNLNCPNDTFWSQYSFTLTSNKKTLLIDINERHFIDYKFALSIPEVANSYEERSDETPFYIVDEERSAEVSNKEFEYLTEAYIILNKMTLAQRRGFSALLGIPVKDSSDAVVLSNLREEAEEDAKAFVEAWKDGSRDIKTLLQELVEYGVIQKRVDSYYFNDALLGVDLLSAINWLSEPVNQDVKLKLKQNLEAVKLSLR